MTIISQDIKIDSSNKKRDKIVCVNDINGNPHMVLFVWLVYMLIIYAIVKFLISINNISLLQSNS